MFVPDDIREGDPPPGAKWYAQLLKCIRTLRVTVSRDSGLTLTYGPSGTAIGLVAPTSAWLGVVTVAFTARGGTGGNTPGGGTVQPYGFDGTALANLGTPVAVKNWTGSTPGVGKRVKYVRMYGALWLDGNDCSSLTP